MGYIFLSYSRREHLKEKTQKALSYLKEKGISIFQDTNELRTGTTWENSLKE